MRHQGEALKDLLRRNKRKQAHLALAAGVDRSTMHRWATTKEWSETQWSKIAAGLKAMQLEPTEIRPLPAHGEPDQLADVWPLVNGLGPKQVEAILQIISLPQTARDIAIAVLRDRVSRNH